MTDQTIDPDTGEILPALITPQDLDALALTDRELVRLSEQVLEATLDLFARQPDIETLIDNKNKTQAIGDYLARQVRAREDKLEAENNIAEARVRYEREIGALIQKMQAAGELAKPGTPNSMLGVESKPTLYDVNITYMQSSRWQALADMPAEQFEEHIQEAKENGWPISTAGLVKHAENGKAPHVSHNSGENEWYTPSYLVEAARATMGTIDLDPASTEIANTVVRAERYFALENDGLSQDWDGTIWLNPPYAQPDITQFANKCKQEYEAGHIEQACILVNNATETAWFRTFLDCASAICLLAGRVKFLDDTLNPANTPLQGQVTLYIGREVMAFSKNFGDYGAVLYV